MNDLLKHIEEAEVEEANIKLDSEGFKIQDMDQANYIVKKVKQIRQEKKEIKNAAKEQLKKYKELIEAWETNSLYPLNNQEEFFTNALQSFAKEMLEGTKKKSIKLINGNIGFKKQVDEISYEEEKLKEYLKKNDLTEYLRIKEEIEKDALKKAGTKKDGFLVLKGEAVPGITFTPREDKFEVK